MEIVEISGVFEVSEISNQSFWPNTKKLRRTLFGSLMVNILQDRESFRFLCLTGLFRKISFFTKHFKSMFRPFTNHLAFLFFTVLAQASFAQTQNYYGNQANPWSGNAWSTSSTGPYNQPLNTTGGGVANFHIEYNMKGTSVTFAGINVTADQFVYAAAGVISNYGSGVITIDVSSGITGDFGNQAFATGSATSGYVKEGDGVFATVGGTYGGGFTLNAGTLIARGVNAMGGNTTNSLTINAGTIATSASTTRDFSNKFPGGININGGFTLGSSASPANSAGSITFSNNASLGSNATRTITLGGTGTYKFTGPISGTSAGITVEATAAGTLELTGQNTYDGLTTVNGGTLKLNRTGGGTLPNTNSIVVDGGTLLVSTNQTVQNLTINSGTVNIASGVTLTVNGTITYGATGTVTGSGTLFVNPNSTISANGPDGVTAAIIASCGCGASNTYEYNGTGAQVTGTGLPATVAGLVINNPSNVTLNAPLTVTTLTLTSGKLILGDNDLTATTINGADESKHIVTSGNGELSMPVAASEKTFPVASGTDSYDPVTITPSASTTFKVGAKKAETAGDFPGTIADFTKVAKRRWNITPTSGSPGSTILKLKNGGTPFTPTSPKMGHYKLATGSWEELAATFSNNTWTATATDFSPFGAAEAGGFASILPVELTFFKAEQMDNAALLTWQTASEFANDFMAVERSSDGGDFMEIGRVSGAGYSSAPNYYRFIDQKPLASTNYYRLRQVDFDGKSSLHPVAVLSFDAQTADVAVFPTMVKEQLELSFSSPVSSPVKLQLFNSAGVQVQSMTILPDNPFVTIPASNLLPGMYFLKLDMENGMVTKRFMKL